MFEWIFLPEAWVALATLTALEVVLGIDNIIFISILVGRLPEHQRQKARQIGLLLAMGMRIALLLAIVWVMGLTETLFSVFSFDFSGRDLILFFGGLFLLGKSTLEIHHSLEGVEEHKTAGKTATFAAIITQIAVIDMVFSLDSVITAVGLVDYVAVMIIAVVVAVLVMMLAAKAIGDFVDSHPTIKMLALSFLILIGFTLMGEGLGFHVPKGYVYFAMAFSLIVELLNIKVRKRNKPVHLKKRIAED
ncbi:TerC family protein [Pseudidiomarina terrestris]|uniref:TerC family protein n=1 Tax=Pseudidiomarina terrestris TaxID=2820060 RepID=A0AAW7R1P7_9GAMM|nr:MULTISPECIES: TerC family protein [unclassified Pseudidiomarina]MDN7125228.1 TerC family protein [Pseudidiomarina sp. 1APP75-32.1]MDN7127371.1 TerC family protein [Pseudidiomarina sp. 1APR75-33.1]MDN7136139.1 TerC family protein [Pseudidiomarina sp. 1ASP75-5]